jgi:aldehyde:ferredoxin oxidoreductase
MWSGLDALCMCLFAGPPLRELTLLDVARIVRAVTGWETSCDEIFLWGRRRWQLMRVYNLREGLRAADDCLPRRFHRESIDAGRHLGTVLDEQNFRGRVAEYYDLVGWDGQGIPKAETVAALNLEWAIGS